jgi:hypothetical protein
LLDTTRVALDLSQYKPPVIRWRWLLDRWWWLWLRIVWWLECLLKLWRRLLFSMPTQLQTQRCWAACSVSVSLFYDSASGWTQCSVVNAELGQTTCCQNGSTSQCTSRGTWTCAQEDAQSGELVCRHGDDHAVRQLGHPAGDVHQRESEHRFLDARLLHGAVAPSIVTPSFRPPPSTPSGGRWRRPAATRAGPAAPSR